MKNKMLKKAISIAATFLILFGNVSSVLADEAMNVSEESYEVIETQTEGPSSADEIISTNETDDTNENIYTDTSANTEETEKLDAKEDRNDSYEPEISKPAILSANYIFESKVESSTFVFISVGEEESILEKAEVVYTLDGAEYLSQAEVKGNVAVVELSGEYELVSMKGIIDGAEFISYLSELDEQEEIPVEEETSDAYVDENISDLDEFVSGDEAFGATDITEALNASADMVEDEPMLFNIGARSKPVIVIDPGHGYSSGGWYTGCSYTYDGVPIYEDVVVMKIARYLKDILEANGVEVHLTREENTMPSPSLEQRVLLAKNVGASALVSIHLNASESASAHGLMAMTAKVGSYNPDNAQKGQNLANTILDELMKLGFGQNYGLYIRDIDDGTTYPDGSLADYYGICRYGQIYNVPSIIIEHGFLSNESDYRN